MRLTTYHTLIKLEIWATAILMASSYLHKCRSSVKTAQLMLRDGPEVLVKYKWAFTSQRVTHGHQQAHAGTRRISWRAVKRLRWWFTTSILVLSMTHLAKVSCAKKLMKDSALDRSADSHTETSNGNDIIHSLTLCVGKCYITFSVLATTRRCPRMTWCNMLLSRTKRSLKWMQCAFIIGRWWPWYCTSACFLFVFCNTNDGEARLSRGTAFQCWSCESSIIFWRLAQSFRGKSSRSKACIVWNACELTRIAISISKETTSRGMNENYGYQNRCSRAFRRTCWCTVDK